LTDDRAFLDQIAIKREVNLDYLTLR
jgi:hypothetical protein